MVESKKNQLEDARTTKTPRLKMQHRMSFRLSGKRLRMNIGKAMQSMMISEEMLKTALVIRWSVRASHCGLGVGTAQ